MAFARPTLTQLRENAINAVLAGRIFDSVTGLVLNPVLLQFDPMSILAQVMAGLAYEEYGYLDYISLQATPFTATDETALGWGALVGITLKPATAATGTVSFVGPPETDLPLGTVLVRADLVSYTTTADEVIPASGTVILPFEASLVGVTGTIAAGAVLTLASPPAGMVTPGSVISSTAPGTDIETADEFRARYLARFSAPPQGGAATDYVVWALAVPGITRAWVLGNVNGPGSVGVYVMLDDSEAADGGFPVGSNGVSALDNNGHPRDIYQIATGDQGTVADALVPLQPVTALVYVLAPIPSPINFTVANLGAANTETNQVAITAALKAVLLTLGDPRGSIIYPSAWTSAIASVAPVFTVITPLAPVVLPAGYLPTVGATSFTT